MPRHGRLTSCSGDSRLPLSLPSFKGLIAEALRQLVGEEGCWQDEVVPPGYCAGESRPDKGDVQILWAGSSGTQAWERDPSSLASFGQETAPDTESLLAQTKVGLSGLAGPHEWQGKPRKGPRGRSGSPSHARIVEGPFGCPDQRLWVGLPRTGMAVLLTHPPTHRAPPRPLFFGPVLQFFAWSLFGGRFGFFCSKARAKHSAASHAFSLQKVSLISTVRGDGFESFALLLSSFRCFHLFTRPQPVSASAERFFSLPPRSCFECFLKRSQEGQKELLVFHTSQLLQHVKFIFPQERDAVPSPGLINSQGFCACFLPSSGEGRGGGLKVQCLVLPEGFVWPDPSSWVLPGLTTLSFGRLPAPHLPFWLLSSTNPPGRGPPGSPCCQDPHLGYTQWVTLQATVAGQALGRKTSFARRELSPAGPPGPQLQSERGALPRHVCGEEPRHNRQLSGGASLPFG